MHTHLSFSQEHTERRMPAVAGRFYPSEPDTLRAEVSKFLAEASKEEKSSRVQAVIVPHAGYVFSGRVAARAFARIAPETSYRHVFLLGPSTKVTKAESKEQAPNNNAEANIPPFAYESDKSHPTDENILM